MKQSPSTEIAWGGSWSRAQRRRCHEVAKSVVTFVSDFASENAIEIREPKRFTFVQGRPSSPIKGLCSDARSIRLILNKHHVSRGEFEESSFEILETGVHESMHAYRFERYPDHLMKWPDYAEHSVHEGLAYASGVIAFRPSTSTVGLVDLARSIELVDPEVDAFQPEELARNIRLMISGRHDESRYGYYLRNRPGRHNICESMGSVAITTLLDNNVPFPDILDAPADQVMHTAADIIDSNE